MSSRSSGFYKHGIHLFFEQDYEQLCIDWPEKFADSNTNKKYDSFTMSLDDWREFAESILEKVEQASE